MGRVLTAAILIILGGSVLYGQNQVAQLNQLDDKGRKQGYWKKYDENGMILYEGAFESDVPVGEFKYYYPDGITRAITVFSDDGQKAATTTYHYTGKVMSEGFYVSQIKDSLWKYYDINGIFLKEEFYRNNQKNGVWRTYYQDGQIAEEIHWKDDLKNGPWIQYYYDGAKKLEGSYLNDEKQGNITYYYPSGRTRITGEYENSYRKGTWYYMNDSSKVIKIEHYEDGKLVKEENFIQVEPEQDSVR